MPAKNTSGDSFTAIISRYGDVFYRILSILISAAILFGVTWLRSEFVSQDRYAKDQAHQNEMIDKISDTLIRMEGKSLVDAAQTETLKDHEVRVRAIERRGYPVKASFKIAEEREKSHEH